MDQLLVSVYMDCHINVYKINYIYVMYSSVETLTEK